MAIETVGAAAPTLASVQIRRQDRAFIITMADGRDARFEPGAALPHGLNDDDRETIAAWRGIWARVDADYEVAS